ncbi:MAG: hypothetical protein J6S40_00935, partial [Thermoguttaceae bacterium]|nr:hypothetical protein [Thermoguttaceae bacterium]
MKHFLHFRTNCPSDTAETRGGEVRSLRKRLARFETLEERALLSVTSAEYADIRASYAEFDLPASIDEVNVIEITADKLSLDKLREAVDAAAATAGDDLIVVRTAEGAHNTVAYDSASDEIAVTFNSSEKGALTIVGYGASPLAIDASGMCRALSIGSGATVSLGNITLTGGSSSKSVSNAGYGGGLYNAGRLTASNLSVTGNTSSYAGGGIFNSGTLRLLNSRVTGNSAAAEYRAIGGGIYSSGTITAENLLVAENTVSGTVAYGGGVYLWSGRFTADGATITNNDAGEGGGFYLFGSSSRKYALTLTDSTLVENGDDASDEIARYNNTNGTLTGDHVLTDYTTWDSSASMVAYDPEKSIVPGISLTGWNGYNDGQSHTVTLTGSALATDTVVYTYNGKTYSAPPAFTAVGTYTVSATVSREGYNDWIGSATVTIIAKTDITNVALTGWTCNYDGQPHTVTLTDPELATDTVVYTYGGKTYNTPPVFTDAGTYSVTATVSREGYNDWTGSATVTITQTTISDVSLTGWSGYYDGQSHTVTLTDPALATDTVVYTYNGETSSAPPAFTAVGTYTVTAKVSRTGYNDWTGSATVTITAKSEIDNVALTGWSGNYDGQSHTVALTDPNLATDTVVYTYNGKTYNAPPTFTEVGTYTVSATVSREGHNNWTGSATVTITAQTDITDVALAGWSGYYDGQSHTVTLTDPALATDTVVYTYNGKTYDTPPVFTAVGTYAVSATVSREGHKDWTGSATVTITAKSEIDNVALTGWSGNYDGQSHTVTLTDPNLATDTVVYTYDGKTSNVPFVFTAVGTYTVSATVSRAGHNDWTGNATVTIAAQTDITNVTLTGWSGYYDGQSHSVTLTDPSSATDTIAYVYNGKTFDTPPAFTEVGTYSVSATVSREGHSDWTGSATVTIIAKPNIDNVSLTGWSGNYDGQSHTVTLTDPDLATDKVVYTYNGQ